jgi:hypothetical protein
MKHSRRLALIIFILLLASPAVAAWTVTVNWTPSPNATSEILLVDTVEQVCEQTGTCTFDIPDLTNQAIIIRSFNVQGAFVNYAAGNLIEADPPSPASGAIIIITIVH